MTAEHTDPVEAFLAGAATHDRMFWLDGGGARPWSGHRSLLGFLDEDDVSLTYDAGAREVRRHQRGRSVVVGDDVFTVLAGEIARDGGAPDVSWVGYLGYASRPDLPARPAADVPDAVWMRVRDPLVIEHQLTAEPTGAVDAGDEPTPGWYAEAFAAVQEELHAGNSYEVNLTYREERASSVDPVTAYLALRAANPAPYAGFLRHGDVALLSSSPERYAVVDRQRWLETKPIKGTTPRGTDAADDAEQATRLAADPKFRAENLMIVDLLRNDLSIVCEPGSVEVPALMQVESYPSVHQLVSTVRGHLRDDVTTVEALRALFPAGSMTGAPKLRTMEIIDRVEESPRGVYAGAFGWISGDGRADLGVVIRSLVARRTSDRDGGEWAYTWGTGGGITVRSDGDEEWAETRWKAARLRAPLIP
ncbi:anthranilate synthase component I family protein [Nocardioides iriomotensis]|nr:anthranilate synthase component I family protein [Nocardioides iriomotensis]